MEKKILHTFGDLNQLCSLYKEARFVYKKPKGGAVDEKAEKGKGDVDEEKKRAAKKLKDEADKKKDELTGEMRDDAKAKSEAELAKLRKDADLPKEPFPSKSLEVKDFLDKDAATQCNQLDWLKINATRENYRINAQTWDHSTPEGLRKMWEDFRKLGILGGTAEDRKYYDSMFVILDGAAGTGNPYLGENNGSYVPMFKSPTDGTSREQVASLKEKGTFKGGEVFLRAFDALTLVRGRLMVQDEKQVATLTAQRKKNEDPIGSKITDFTKSNIAVLQKAAKEKDFATLGVYAVGMYALWKTVGSKLFGGGDGHDGGAAHAGKGFDFKKWLMIGAAVYGADKVLKNAGYDVLKISGFKGMDAEVKGTPLASMGMILAQYQIDNPQDKTEFKDLDYGIAMQMSETKLSTLQGHLMKANKDGIRFIHPNKFPSIFEDLKNVWPFKSGLAARLDDNTGMNGKHFSGKEGEYVRVGQQLYKLAMAMPIVYEKTLYKNHEKYKGKSYEKMLAADDLSGQLKVRHLMEAVSDYAPEGDMGGVFSGKKPMEIEGKLRAGTDKALGGNGFTLDTIELQQGSGHIAGQLKGFPIVVVATKDEYRVYLQNDYSDKKGYNPAPSSKFTPIPLSGGGMERAAKDAVKKVDARMAELAKKLGDNNKDIVLPLTYDGGQWKATTTFNGAADLGVAATNVSTLVRVDDLGKMLRLDDGETSSDNYLERIVIGRLLDQSEFHALRYFGAVKRLGMTKVPKSTDGVFTLLIGQNKDISAKIKYNGSRFEFADPADEAKMLAPGSKFKQEFKNALGEDEKMAEVTKSWEKAISAAPSDYLKNFVKHVPDIFTRATLDNPFRGLSLDMIDGSVAKNYAMSMIEAQKSLILAKVASGIDGASSLADVSKKVGQIYTPNIDKLNSLSGDFTRLAIQHERDGKNVTDEEFNESVIGKIGEVGIESSDYKTWYAEFTNELFLHYGVNNLRPGNAKKARDVAKVFAYYTAVLDDRSIDGANLSLPVTKEAEDYIQRIKASRVAWARTKPNPTNDEVAAEVNAQLRVANPAGLPNLTGSDIPKLEATEKEIDRNIKYKTYAKYKKVVSDQIFAKLNDVDEKVVVPSPEDHGFWKIPDFKSWAPANTVKLHEAVDTNERIKMNRDYIPLDEYFKMSAAERLIHKDNVILPRASARFVIRMKPDLSGPIPDDAGKYELIKKLLEFKANGSKVIIPQVFEYTKAETAFREKILKVLDQIDKKYGVRGKNILKDRFSELKDMFNYSANFTRDLETDAAGNKSVVYGYTFSEPDNQLASEMKDFDAKFDKASFATITKADQTTYINKQVENFVTQTVLSDYGKMTYFKEEKGVLDTVGNALKQIALDIREWLT